MKLVLYLSGMVMVVVCATWAYRVNYATQEALGRVADLRDEIAAEREAIAVLNAEWEYLNRPDRLMQLVKANADELGLEELTPAQFGEVASAPFPPEPDDDLAAMVAGIVSEHREGKAEARPAKPAPAIPRPVRTSATTEPLARPIGDTQ